MIVNSENIPVSCIGVGDILHSSFLLRFYSFLIWNWANYIVLCRIPEAVAQRSSIEKVFLGILQNSQKSTGARVSFAKVAGLETSIFLKKETVAQVFFCEFCKISKNTFS